MVYYVIMTQVITFKNRYDHLPHIGYDLDGKRIARPIKTKDEIDDFLARCEDPNYWKQITDKSTLRYV